LLISLISDVSVFFVKCGFVFFPENDYQYPWDGVVFVHVLDHVDFSLKNKFKVVGERLYIIHMAFKGPITLAYGMCVFIWVFRVYVFSMTNEMGGRHACQMRLI
jgi:hypothetical protein